MAPMAPIEEKALYLIILNFAPFGTFIALCGHCGAYFWVRVKFKNIFGPTNID